ncbi:hypothetical protein Tco_1009047 [Tanacetum coccineum]
MPRFLQLYIYDTENEVANRMRHLGGIDSSSLDSRIIEGVQLFRIARDKCREMDIPKFKIRLYNAKVAHGYELPTSNTLGAMVFDSGFHTKLKLRSANGSGNAKRVTMLGTTDSCYTIVYAKRHAFWSLNEEISRYYSDKLYAVSIKEDKTYLCLHFIRNHEELKSNTPYLEDSIRFMYFRSYALSWKPCQGDSLNLPDHRAQVDQGSQIKMIQVKEMMQDNDLKNLKSKDKGSKSRSQSMDEQSHYKQDKTITRQSINVKRHIFNVIGDTEKFEERDLNIGGDC